MVLAMSGTSPQWWMAGHRVPRRGLTRRVRTSVAGAPSEASGADPWVTWIRSQPGLAERLLAEHIDDGTGRCRVCSAGGQTGRLLDLAKTKARLPADRTGGRRAAVRPVSRAELALRALHGFIGRGDVGG